MKHQSTITIAIGPIVGILAASLWWLATDTRRFDANEVEQAHRAGFTSVAQYRAVHDLTSHIRNNRVTPADFVLLQDVMQHCGIKAKMLALVRLNNVTDVDLQKRVLQTLKPYMHDEQLRLSYYHLFRNYLNSAGRTYIQQLTTDSDPNVSVLARMAIDRVPPSRIGKYAVNYAGLASPHR